MTASIPQPLAQLQALPIKPRKCCCSIRDLFFAPIRFCGRQWMWVKDTNKNSISQIALKVLLVPFLACLTLLSGLPAVIGALIFSPKPIDYTDYNPGAGLSLLRRDTSNEQIAERIQEHLNSKGHKYSVNVRSMDRERIRNDNYYPENIHRYVTVTNPSNTKATRFKEVLKNHFYNKDVSSLSALFPCIRGLGTEEGCKQLRDVLALYKAITFSIPYDLAYLSIESD